jgi:phage-related protein
MGDSVGSVSLGIQFDGNSIQKSINDTMSKVKSSVDNSTKGIADNISKNTKKAVNDSVKSLNQLDEKINKILNDTTRSDKSKAMSIASVLQKNEGLNKSDSIIKAYDIVGRKAKEVGDTVSASTDKATKKTNKFFNLFKRNTDKAKKQAESVGNSLNIGIGGALAKLGKLAIAAFSVRAITNFGKECIELGSNLSEVQNIVDSTFTTMSEKVNEYAQTSITRLGMSETTYKKMVGTMGAMSKSFGFTEDEALKMSDTITALTADVASFYNLSHEEAYTKMKSIYTGETESLKELGVVMTQAALDEFALANGFGKTTKSMTEQEKVALRYNFVMKQLETASGDFQRTSNGWANQTRILSENFNKLKASIGQGLINALLPVVRVLNTLMSKLQILADMFSNFTDKIFGKAETSTSSISSTLTDLGNTSDLTSEAIGGVADSVSDAAKTINKTTFGFDELNTLQAPDDSSGGSGGGVGDVGGGILSTTTEQSKLNEETSVYETILDRLIKKVKELTNLFKKGFKFGLDTTGFSGAIENIKSSINSIKESFKNIFGDGQVLNALDDFINTYIYTLGSMVGTVLGIGASIGNALISGIAEYLENNSGFLKEKFTNILNGLSESVSIIGQVFSDVGQILADTFNSSEASTLVSNFISVIVNPFLEFKEFAIQLFNDIIGGVADFISRYKEELTTGLRNTFSIVSDIIKGIEIIVLDVIDILKGAYETYVKPILENLGTKINDLMDNYIIPLGNTFVECWNKIADNLSIIWENYLKPFVEWFVNNLVADITKALNNIINIGSIFLGRIIQFVDGMIRIISGIIDFLVGVFTGDWDKAWTGIKDIFRGFWEQVKSIVGFFIDLTYELFGDFLRNVSNNWTNTWNSIKSFFSGIGSSISNIVSSMVSIGTDLIGRFCSFVGNGFSSIGEGAKNVFNGIFNTVKSVFGSLISIIKSPINTIIGLVNNIISKINNLSIDVPDWVTAITGFTTFGFNLPQIPQLANGGYITAPTLAMVGEGSENEIVAPESKLREIRDEGTNSTNLLLSQMIEQNKQMIQVMNLLLNKNQDLYFDTSKVGSLITNYQTSETRRVKG